MHTVTQDDATIAVDLLEAHAAEDPTVVDRLAELVNRVYAVAEAGLWRDGMVRTSRAELARLVEAVLQLGQLGRVHDRPDRARVAPQAGGGHAQQALRLGVDVGEGPAAIMAAVQLEHAAGQLVEQGGCSGAGLRSRPSLRSFSAHALNGRLKLRRSN